MFTIFKIGFKIKDFIIKKTKDFSENSLLYFVNKEKINDFVNYIEKIVLITSLTQNIAQKNGEDKVTKKRKM